MSAVKGGLLTAADYRKLLKQSVSGAYLFFGEEEFMKRFCLTETRKYITSDKTLAAFNILRYSATEDEFSYDSIMNALSSPPMFCDRRLIELHDLDLNSAKEDDFDILGNIAASIDDETIFILYAYDGELSCGDIAKNRPTKAYARLSESFRPVMFGYETPAKLASWVSKHFVAEAVAADMSLCYSLMERCGHSMHILSSEITKLCEYLKAAGRNALTEEDIRAVSCEYTEFGEFAFSNAILDGDTENAYRILEVMRDNREKPEIILAAITRVFADMSFIRALSDSGLSSADIAQRLSMNAYKVGLYQKAMSKTETPKLIRLTESCLEADVRIKSSAPDKFLVIDRLIQAVGA